MSPDGTTTCDCGFEFDAAPDLLEADLLAARRSAIGGIVAGLLVAAGALAASAFWSQEREEGVLFYGAIIAGLIWAGTSAKKLAHVNQAMREADQPARSGASSARDAERVHVYRVKIPGEGMQEVVSLLPQRIVFARGLVPQAIVGKLLTPTFEGGTLTPQNFIANTAFVDFLHEVVRRYGPEQPGIVAEAGRLGQGRMFILDGRTPTPQGAVPPSDIIGAFPVTDGVLQPDSYERNRNHLILSERGFFQLESVLHERLMDELRQRYDVEHGVGVAAADQEGGGDL